MFEPHRLERFLCDGYDFELRVLVDFVQRRYGADAETRSRSFAVAIRSIDRSIWEELQLAQLAAVFAKFRNQSDRVLVVFVLPEHVDELLGWVHCELMLNDWLWPRGVSVVAAGP
ncbi:hypothetical protein QFZ83_004824 [Variovorax sp. W1I1]|nr:hypothetical protein [Variovorax sp. W1I1]